MQLRPVRRSSSGRPDRPGAKWGRRFRPIWAGLLLVVGALGVSPAGAQTIKPLDVEQDPNGVDLISGRVEPRMPVLEVPGSSNLRLQRLQDLVPVLEGTLVPGGFGSANYSINGGGVSSELFHCDDQGDCRPEKKNGSHLQANVASRQFTYIEGGTAKRIFFNLRSGSQDPITSGIPFTFHPSYIAIPAGSS